MNGGTPLAGSIAHQHVAAVLNTLMTHRAAGVPVVRILDVGVGDGRFLEYLLGVLPRWQPGVTLEVYGLDVDRWTVFEKQGRPRLRAAFPDVDWDAHLAFIKPGAAWPFADGDFDFITSNQVLEHVEDKAHFFGEVRRCLKPGGTGVHLFPVTEVLWEGHARMPLVHWFGDPWRQRAIRLFAALGFTRTYRAERARRKWKSLGEFAMQYSAVLGRNTAYSSVAALRPMVSAAGLGMSFTYTKDYYLAKLLSYAGVRPRRYRDLGAMETAFMYALRHIASITVLLRRAGV